MTKKETLHFIVENWNTMNITELVEKTGKSKSFVNYNATKMRKMGIPLSKRGRVYSPEFVEELKAAYAEQV